VETTPKARKLEQAALWIVVGLFLALSMSWAVYPRVYDHYHPTPPWPGQLDHWFPSNAQLSFLVAALLAVLGFLQIGFRRRLQRDTSRFLFWVFLLLSLGWAVDCWTFSLSIRFWTVNMGMQSNLSHRAYEMSSMLAGYFSRPIVAIGLLNIGLAWFRKRSSRVVPGRVAQSGKRTDS
jgi:glucan phosphoethanolaminetransferase (alkaline phosphatase superfamily)